MILWGTASRTKLTACVHSPSFERTHCWPNVCVRLRASVFVHLVSTSLRVLKYRSVPFLPMHRIIPALGKNQFNEDFRQKIFSQTNRHISIQLTPAISQLSKKFPQTPNLIGADITKRKSSSPLPPTKMRLLPGRCLQCLPQSCHYTWSLENLHIIMIFKPGRDPSSLNRPISLINTKFPPHPLLPPL